MLTQPADGTGGRAADRRFIGQGSRRISAPPALTRSGDMKGVSQAEGPIYAAFRTFGRLRR